MKVTKSNWTQEEFNMWKIENVYKRIIRWLNKQCPFSHLEENIKTFIVDWISTENINKIIIKSAISLITHQNGDWQYVAGRFAILNLYKRVSREREISEELLYSPLAFLSLIKEYEAEGKYFKFSEHYTEEEIIALGHYIDKYRDFEYNYTTVLMYDKRYLLNHNNKYRELPQQMYMAIAMYLAIPEKDKLRFAKKIYDSCSRWEISLPTPTLLNARTNFQQLSSCFEFNVDDDLRGIFHSVENMAQVSKYGWWIWVYLWNIRSKWGSIRGVKWTSGGVMPWAKIINWTAVAVNQLWARAWAISVTLDVWHKDILDFLEMQTEVWDVRTKAYDLFPAITFPDLFMERVKNNQLFTLFDPKEVFDVTGKRLQNYYWKEFEEFYRKCELNPRLELKETVNAKEIFKHYLKTVVETGMPYAFFRDTVNKNNPNKHCWMIYHTNLCTEIQQNTSPSKFIEEITEDWEIHISYTPWDAVTCNLASINVAKVNTPEQIKNVTEIAARLLDNVITLNYHPLQETKITSEKYRPVGLWFLWLAEYLAVNKIWYDTEKARERVDALFREFSFYMVNSSKELSKERWYYPMFPWSDWEKWIFQWRTFEELWWERGIILKEKMQKYGSRFGYMLAPAPNTSTSLVVGTTASVLPIYKKYYIETNSKGTNITVAPNINEENFWYYKEYTNMRMDSVIDLVSVIYKYIDQSCSFEWMINPVNTSPKDLYSYYFRAWEKWIKTVYYVRSMSVEAQKCESCSW